MSDGGKSGIIPAFTLARLRDRSMGQADEVQALVDLVKGMTQVTEVTNHIFMAMLKKEKPRNPTLNKAMIDEAFTIIATGLEKFVDAKVGRISKLIHYLQLLHQDVNNEKKNLETFETKWDPIKRELNLVRIEFANKSFSEVQKDDPMKEIDHLKNNIMGKALPILEQLTDLENSMQKRHISAIALLTTVNSSLDTNELYKLLTDDP